MSCNRLSTRPPGSAVFPVGLYRLLRLFSGLCLIPGLFLVPGLCLAEPSFKVTPDIRAESAYHDNLFSRGREDLEYILSPSLRFQGETERSSLKGRLGLQDFTYARETQYDRTQYQADFGARHQMTERLDFSLDGSWGKDYVIEDYLDENYRLRSNPSRKTWNIAPGLRYRLSERDTLMLNGSYARQRYEHDALPGYTALGGGIGLEHALLDGTLSLLGQASAQFYEFDAPMQDIRQDNYNVMAGVLWTPLEQLSVRALGGVNVIKSEVEYTRSAMGRDYSLSETGFTGSLSATWSEKDWSSTLDAARTEYPSLYGELNTRDEYTLRFSKQISPRWNVYSHINFSTIENDGIISKTSKEYWSFHAQMTYKLTEKLSVGLRYRYTDSLNKLRDNRDIGNIISVQFAWELPSFSADGIR